MNKKPTSVVVLSIIGIILTALSFFGLIASLLVTFIDFGAPNPVNDAIRNDRAFQVMTVVSVIIGIPVLILQLWAAISSLRLKRWARRGTIVCAWIAIVQLVLGAIFNFVHEYPLMAAAAVGADPAIASSVKIGMFSGACGMCLGFIFPICVLYFFSRPHVIDAFNGIVPAAPTPFPVEMNPPLPESNDAPTDPFP